GCSHLVRPSDRPSRAPAPRTGRGCPAPPHAGGVLRAPLARRALHRRAGRDLGHRDPAQPQARPRPDAGRRRRAAAAVRRRAPARAPRGHRRRGRGRRRSDRGRPDGRPPARRLREGAAPRRGVDRGDGGPRHRPRAPRRRARRRLPRAPALGRGVRRAWRAARRRGRGGPRRHAAHRLLALARPQARPRAARVGAPDRRQRGRRV
ncbi:MAG: hypothetical protein AVDCRST_MAG11-420, partial [uncultured Gemmatimonadaceae bacterium]